MGQTRRKGAQQAPQNGPRRPRWPRCRSRPRRRTVHTREQPTSSSPTDMPTHAPPVLRPAAGLHGSGSASCKTSARGARAALSSALARLLEEAHCISHAASCFEAAALVRLVLGSWGNTTRARLGTRKGGKRGVRLPRILVLIICYLAGSCPAPRGHGCRRQRCAA